MIFYTLIIDISFTPFIFTFVINILFLCVLQSFSRRPSCTPTRRAPCVSTRRTVNHAHPSRPSSCCPWSANSDKNSICQSPSEPSSPLSWRSRRLRWKSGSRTGERNPRDFRKRNWRSYACTPSPWCRPCLDFRFRWAWCPRVCCRELATPGCPPYPRAAPPWRPTPCTLTRHWRATTPRPPWCYHTNATKWPPGILQTKGIKPIGSMCRRWSNIDQTLASCLEFAGTLLK